MPPLSSIVLVFVYASYLRCGMIVYCLAVIRPVLSTISFASPRPAVLPVEKASTSIDTSTLCTSFFSTFSLPDITSVKRYPRQRVLGSLMSGSYLRIP